MYELCKICGKKTANPRHIKTHGMTYKEYKKKYIEVEEEESQSAQQELVCRKCGAYLEPDSDICTVCDAPVEEGVEETPQAEEEEEEDEYSMTIMEWQAQGYNTTYLEELMDTASKQELDEAFDLYEENLERLREIIRNVEDIETDERMAKDVLSIRELLTNPMKVDDVEASLEGLMKKIHINRLRDELYELDTRGLETQVNEVEEFMKNPDNIAAIQKKISDLRREIKARFFEGAVAMEFTPKKKVVHRKIRIVRKEAQKASAETLVRDLMVLHRDGTLLSHLTRRSKEDFQNMKLKQINHLIQSKVRLPRDQVGLNIVEYYDDKLVIHNGPNLSMILIISGDMRKGLDSVLNKAIGLLEKRYHDKLEGWKGDPADLSGIAKYTDILMDAFVKMEK